MVDECKLRVLYISPPQPTVPEGSEEGLSSPRGSIRLSWQALCLIEGVITTKDLIA